MKIFTLGQNCTVTSLIRSNFDCESSFYNWAFVSSLWDSIRPLLLTSNALKVIIYGQYQYLTHGSRIHELNTSKFKIDTNIFFNHYTYKSLDDTVCLVRRFCRTKIAFDDLKNNIFIFSLFMPGLYRVNGYLDTIKNFDENYYMTKMIEDNVLFFNPFNCDMNYYDKPIVKFKNVFNGPFEYKERQTDEELNDMFLWMSKILFDKFPSLKKNNRTIKTKTNNIPNFFKEVYNTKDYFEFLYNVKNLGIIRYIASNAFDVKLNRNNIKYSNEYFSISAKNEEELWDKIYNFCLESVKFIDNYEIV